MLRRYRPGGTVNVPTFEIWQNGVIQEDYYAEATQLTREEFHYHLGQLHNSRYGPRFSPIMKVWADTSCSAYVYSLLHRATGRGVRIQFYAKYTTCIGRDSQLLGVTDEVAASTIQIDPKKVENLTKTIQ